MLFDTPVAFTKAERRQSSYTDTLIAALTMGATGSGPATPATLGALEIAAGVWARCFAAATVTPDTPGITPEFLATVARALIRHGEVVYLIDVTESGSVRLIPCSHWDIRGTARAWSYRVDLQGPDETTTTTRGAEGVCHFRYAVDSARPYRGVSPLGWATHTGALASAIETSLSREHSGPVGHLVPVPESHGEGDGTATDPFSASQGRHSADARTDLARRDDGQRVRRRGRSPG